MGQTLNNLKSIPGKMMAALKLMTPDKDGWYEQAELVTRWPGSRSSLQRHLKAVKQAELVEAKKKGKKSFIRILAYDVEDLKTNIPQGARSDVEQVMASFPGRRTQLEMNLAKSLKGINSITRLNQVVEEVMVALALDEITREKADSLTKILEIKRRVLESPEMQREGEFRGMAARELVEQIQNKLQALAGVSGPDGKIFKPNDQVAPIIEHLVDVMEGTEPDV